MKLVKTTALILFLLLASVPVFAQKLKPEEIVAKHLDSIATAEARSSAKTRFIVGDVLITFVSKKNQTAVGRVVLASEGNKSLVGMNLNAADYTNEKFTYDGNKSKVALAFLMKRSPLGDYITANDAMLSHGLLGGALSTGWAMLRTAEGKGKLSGGGLKKIDGKEVYAVGYGPKGGGDAEITLYFEKDTFRHVRTEYKSVVSAGIGRTPDQSAGMDETRKKLVEDYGDFKDEGGLMMPHSYKITYSETGARGTSEIQWAMVLNTFTANQKLEANTFEN
jgi:hypothetical protein